LRRDGRDAGGDTRGVPAALHGEQLRRRRRRLPAVEHRGDAVRHGGVGARAAGVRGGGAQHVRLRPVRREGGLRRVRHHPGRRPREAPALAGRRAVPRQRRRSGGAGAGRDVQLRLEQAVRLPAGLVHGGVLVEDQPEIVLPKKLMAAF
jgi:hypothetical protein